MRTDPGSFFAPAMQYSKALFSMTGAIYEKTKSWDWTVRAEPEKQLSSVHIITGSSITCRCFWVTTPNWG